DAAEQLGDGKSGPAARQGRRAAEDLEGLAAGLREVQQAVGQAELEKLIEAERRAAELLERMQAAKSAADQALARAKASELSDAVAPLSRGDRQLREANQQLKSATSPNSSASSRTPGSDRLGNSTPQSFVDDDRDPTTDPRPAEVGESGRRDVESLRRLDQVLQRRIQEAILNGSLQQADEAVPPPYKDMIESYYRALSEDIE
ncbi:MAG: hypothetical protein KDA55_00545, partial [Planctomycetales bacterium]|nr:hypothetical protein [Planctomycetales bacterium]